MSAHDCSSSEGSSDNEGLDDGGPAAAEVRSEFAEDTQVQQILGAAADEVMEVVTVLGWCNGPYSPYQVPW